MTYLIRQSADKHIQGSASYSSLCTLSLTTVKWRADDCEQWLSIDRIGDTAEVRGARGTVLCARRLPGNQPRRAGHRPKLRQ